MSICPNRESRPTKQTDLYWSLIKNQNLKQLVIFFIQTHSVFARMNGWPLESSGLDLSRVFIERTQVLNRGLKFFGEKIDVLFEVGIFELLTDCQICNCFKTLYSTICYRVVSRYLTVYRLSIKFWIRARKKVFFDINSYSFF